MSVIREVVSPLQQPKEQYSVIRLTQGYTALVDPEDFEKFGKLNWCSLIDPKTGKVYAAMATTAK